MVYEKELELSCGSLYYRAEESGIRITRSGRLQGCLELPDQIDGIPVTAIQKKTFLSQKKLESVVLPDSLEEIGEWAFAYCSSLVSVRLPRKKLNRGKGIFLECRSLEEIIPEGNDCGAAEYQQGRQTARLLAAAVILLDAEYLLEPAEAGSKEWLAKWDARMQEALQREETEGYTKTILCGEEDLDSDLDTYRKSVRREKARLCFRRLMNDVGLSEENRQKLTDFLLSHTKGAESEEAWELLLSEYGDDRAYFSFFCEIGAVTGDNRSAMLADMGEGHAEMKAFLVRQGQESKEEQQDFFASLTL